MMYAIIFESLEFNGIHIKKNRWLPWHGRNVCKSSSRTISRRCDGRYFEAADEPTVYLVGDTVWTSDVEKALLRFDPNVNYYERLDMLKF